MTTILNDLGDEYEAMKVLNQQLLRQKEVLDDLKADDVQRVKIEQLKKRRANLWNEYKNNPRGSDREELNWRFRDLTASQQKELENTILRAEQAERLQQLSLQYLGLNAFRELKVIDTLHLTDAQKERIQDLVDGGNLMQSAFGSYVSSDGSLQAVRKIREQVKQAAMEKIIQLLDADQLVQWQRLVGRPFQAEFQRRWGGPEGGPARGR